MRARFEILAKSQCNHWVWLNSPIQPGSGSNLYDYNVAQHAPIGEFLAALKAHEGDGVPGIAHSGHTSSFREFIDRERTKRDPRVISEAAVGTGAQAVARRLDGELRSDEKAICAAADDPLAQISTTRSGCGRQPRADGWTTPHSRWVEVRRLTRVPGA